MSKSPYEIIYYTTTHSGNGLYIQLLSTKDQSIYYYYESLGSVDIRDLRNEWIGGEVYDEIYEFVENNCNTLIRLFNDTI